MGKLVNVVLDNGKTVAIPEEDAARLSGAHIAQPETDQGALARVTGAKNAERASGVVQGAKTILEGGLDTLSGGGFGKVAGAISSDYAEDMANRGQNRPGLRAVGELGAFALPVGLPGLASKAGEAVSAGVVGSAVNPVTRGVAGFANAAGRAVEGGILGAGGHVASTNVTGDPLTVEGTLLNVGLGGLLNVGIGAAADRIQRGGQRLLDDVAGRAASRTDSKLVREGRDIFEKDPESWGAFKDAVKAADKSERRAVTDAQKAADKYNDFATANSGKKLEIEITKTEKALNSISRTAGEEASPAMRESLAEWRQKLREIDQTRVGKFDPIAGRKGGRYVQSDAAPDPVSAMEQLRSLRAELEGGRVASDGTRVGPFPAATRHASFDAIPEMPPSIPEMPEAIRLPSSLKDFASMEVPTARKLSDLVARDPAAQAEFGKLVNDLGVNGADGIAGLHAELGKYVSAGNRLAEAARKEAADEADAGLLGILKNSAKNFIRGRFGGPAAFAMNPTDALINGAMMHSKKGVRDVVESMLGKVSGPASLGMRKLGPITAYLSANPFTGTPDSSGTMRAQAVRRVNDVIAANGNAPDALFVAVQGLMGHPSDIAWKLHQKAVGDLQYLLATAPKDPGIAQHQLKSTWEPSFNDSMAFAHRIEAVTNPLKAIARSIAGDSHPAAVEALWARWPALMQAAAGEFAYALPDMKLDYRQASRYSALFRTPITGLMNPAVKMTLQGLYLPKAPPASSQPAPTSTGNPVGRPAAVQSPVAGSSVSGLLSQ